MTLEEIWEACRSLKIKEMREQSAEYAELVFFDQDIEGCVIVLESFLGKPTKPAGTAPTPAQIKMTDEFGGIYKGQTLFEKQINGGWVIAMLWPWSDGMHITLKMALVSKPSA